MHISPDSTIFWTIGWFNINATILFTWCIIVLLAGVAWSASRRLVSGFHASRWQSFLEVLTLAVRTQIEDIGVAHPETYISFIGTLFVFLVTANILSVIPGFITPTSSLSTTAALAIAVFFSVIFFGIKEQGWKNYFQTYLEPAPILLPFNVIGELSRTIALAVRLFGNMMSGEMIVSIFLALTPFFFPALMSALGLLIGMIQAYIFTVLATVYIAAATHVHRESGVQHG
jgi:F-type H+-transporting ATPase subunit a